MSIQKKHVLYVSYTGLMEPLGRSQILSYLLRLSSDYNFTIVSFEKTENLNDLKSLHALQEECAASGIEWIYKEYHSTPRLLATAWDLFVLVCSVVKLSLLRQSSIVHCRSYIPAFAVWLSTRFTRTPFLFDMRALWIDEMVTAGRLSETSLLFKVLKKCERRILNDAAASVSLTVKAVEYLSANYPEINLSNIAVIPTCVNLELFFPSERGNESIYKSTVVIGSVGSLSSGWFPLDWLFQLYCASNAEKETDLLIVTKDCVGVVEPLAEQYKVDLNDITIHSVEPADVTSQIHNMTYGVVFNSASVGRLGSFPTRMAEFLACGIPVIGNSGVGDVADIIRRYNVGVIVDDNSTESFKSAVDEMTELLKDSELKARCLDAARDYFSADVGAEKYEAIYRQISNAY
ncbi:D-inositol-3-phosphate glycosyltransferase [BD1-7 clade bacterium]|uniref:D-inositol-3-phosphate glycosyltransferase n=1 Tax=BD1-7 clade bacterium TaxID=2029982 RepID=A0A5S9MRP1_9GAMM|nr:D-inositol-3-phosphate glycosyltransferase [BD1-7 clade bacterium]